MNKILIFLPLFLFGLTFPHNLTLKKDEKATFNITYKGFSHKFTLWWTLYKNKILTVLYIYNNFPHQISLYKDYPLNSFKLKISDLDENSPYLWIKFEKFQDKNATFKIYLFNKKGVKVDKGNK